MHNETTRPLDVAVECSYIAGRVSPGEPTILELLLILSALLSALTGAMGTRAPELRPHQAAIVRVAAPVAPARRAARRPAVVVPTLPVMALRSVAAGFALADTIPLYALRRRE